MHVYVNVYVHSLRRRLHSGGKRLKVFTIAGPKGGCGKSLTTTALAVRATMETGRVALLDMNEGQGTLTEWWTLRGRPVNPFLHEAEGTLDELIADLRRTGWTYCFIDGPPQEQDLIEMTVLVADAVVIPVKLAYFDTSGDRLPRRHVRAPPEAPRLPHQRVRRPQGLHERQQHRSGDARRPRHRS